MLNDDMDNINPMEMEKVDFFFFFFFSLLSEYR